MKKNYEDYIPKEITFSTKYKEMIKGKLESLDIVVRMEDEEGEETELFVYGTKELFIELETFGQQEGIYIKIEEPYVCGYIC